MPLSLRFFPRFFFLYFMIFHIYFFSYAYGKFLCKLQHIFFCNHLALHAAVESLTEFCPVVSICKAVEFDVCVVNY